MNDLEFVDRRARDVQGRLRRGSRALWLEFERSVGPRVRKHPRTGLAVGAAAGLLIGHALAPTRRPVGTRRSSRRFGPLAWIRGTLEFALRTAIVSAMRPRAASRAASGER